jgi:hypothetical protein
MSKLSFIVIANSSPERNKLSLFTFQIAIDQFKIVVVALHSITSLTRRFGTTQYLFPAPARVSDSQ